MTQEPVGQLFVIATPIGNLEDITIRALKTLRQVDVIAAEDTRRTRQLLARYKIHKPLIACHDHNEAQMAVKIISRLRQGQNVALVSDAGTPAVSDPGFALVRQVVDAGLRCVPVPGPSALTAALSISHLPVNAFIFLGFLPRKAGARQRALEDVARTPRSFVIFLSPHNALAGVNELLLHVGDRDVVACRELTKLHEEIWRGPLSGLAAHFSAEPPRGEMTVIVQGLLEQAENASEDEIRQALRAAIAAGSEERRAIAKRLSLRFGVPSRQIYRWSLDLDGL